MYKDMPKILHEKKQGNAEIKHHIVSEYDFRAIYHDGMQADKEYVFLMIDGELMMSDAPMEMVSNANIITNAHGDMLVGGLGIGLILLPLMDKSNVNSIAIIEKNQNVIDIVAGQLELNDKVTIIHDDVLTYKPNRKYDCIYMDIWPVICRDNAGQMRYLSEKYKEYLTDNPNSWIRCWQEDYVLGYSDEICK